MFYEYAHHCTVIPLFMISLFLSKKSYPTSPSPTYFDVGYYNNIFHYRTTAYGFLSAASRIAGVLGSLCFGQFIYSSQAIPMLTTSAVLLTGAIVSLKIKETKDNLL